MLRGIVIGTGWAGEGYVTALRQAEVEIVALCGRSPEPTRAMGARLGVADVRLDWRAAIDDLLPDIVVVATPAEPHREMVEYAAERGAHVVCEKPLGLSADDGRRMLAAVEAAGVKHAYGTTSRYAPGLSRARTLVESGAIGDVLEVELVDHFGMSPLFPHCWIHSLQHGGGLLSNAYTHYLGQSQYVTGGVARWATGHTERVVSQVPVGPPVHDFREWEPVDPDRAASGEWRENDADLAATVITGLELPEGRQVPALFRVSAFTSARAVGYLAIFGSTGTLHLEGQPWFNTLRHFTTADGQWADIALPAVDDPIQSGWTRLVADFVADINGSGGDGYPTFRDGHRANLLIDQVRAATAAADALDRPTTSLTGSGADDSEL
jgi:predicted dehydrogenase